MLNNTKWNQYGTPRKESVIGITIHNTGNDKSAKELENIMAATSNHLATHYFVDDVEIIQVMPEEYSVWHTGKGYDMGNMRTIAIEICERNYPEAEARAIGLVKSLLDKYNLTKDDIYFHSDFSYTYCPHRILDFYKTKKNFVERNFK